MGVAAYVEKGGQRYRIISDHLGSARMVVNADTCVVAQRLEFDAWGEILEDTNPGFQPFAFTGREWEPETGLYYYRARPHDPKVGRFISEDPIGFAGGIKPHAYVGNQPTMSADPFGPEGWAISSNDATSRTLNILAKMPGAKTQHRGGVEGMRQSATVSVGEF